MASASISPSGSISRSISPSRSVSPSGSISPSASISPSPSIGIESIRKDSAVRQLQQKQVNDFSGKRLILPTCTSLPATGFEGEVKVLVSGGTISFYIWSNGDKAWIGTQFASPSASRSPSKSISPSASVSPST